VSRDFIDLVETNTLSDLRERKSTEILCNKTVIVTSPTIPGWKITQVMGIVTGEAIIGANVFRDLFAAITDIVGGRAGAYEEALNHARETALDDIRYQAEMRGANANVACDLDYETPGTMLMVAASGMAVKIEPECES